jgi:hypothetical protein
MHIHIAAATIHLTLPEGIPGQLLEFQQLAEAIAQPAPSRTTGTPPTPGELWPGQGGRYICTLPALFGLPERHLIVSEDEADKLTFGPNVEVPGATSHVDGRTNTAALLAHEKSHPAAQWAAAYTKDGHTDFHLPSRLDLLMAWLCAPQLFNKDGYYWSSTQTSRFRAFVQDFEDGYSYWYSKDDERRVRAFRAIHLTA